MCMCFYSNHQIRRYKKPTVAVVIIAYKKSSKQSSDMLRETEQYNFVKNRHCKFSDYTVYHLLKKK